MLDDIKKIKQLDSKNMLGSIELLQGQADEVQKAAQKLKLPNNYSSVKNIVLAGMGGSTLGTHVIKSLFYRQLPIPLEIANNYYLPDYVDENTLVVLSSYSGNTEEVLNAAQEALKKRARIVAITKGGKLEKWSKKNHLPTIVYETKNNLCGSPRMGVGYALFGQIFLLAKLGFLKFSKTQINLAKTVTGSFLFKYGVKIPLQNNPAKQLAAKINENSVWFIGSEHLSGNVHTAANQINETAKRFAGYHLLPELNHHLLEGMFFPKSNPKNLLFILFTSDLYDKRVQKRYAITEDILRKNKINYSVYRFKSKDRLSQVCEALVLSSYVSFYSAVINGIDPTAIPYVDYFKKQMSK